MRLEEVTQGLVITALLLTALLWFSASHWEEIVAPAFRTFGALAQVMRVPILVLLAVALGFLALRLNGPRR